MRPKLIEFIDISKRFGGTLALKSVSLDIHEGEIVAQGTALELKNAVRKGTKSEPTMEEVFIHYTDTEWKDAIADV